MPETHGSTPATEAGREKPCEHEWVAHFDGNGSLVSVECRVCSTDGTSIDGLPLSGITLRTDTARYVSSDFNAPLIYSVGWSAHHDPQA